MEEMIKKFHEWWGSRGEKWNGKLDIKTYSLEIWLLSYEASKSLEKQKQQ